MLAALLLISGNPSHLLMIEVLSLIQCWLKMSRPCPKLHSFYSFTSYPTATNNAECAVKTLRTEIRKEVYVISGELLYHFRVVVSNADKCQKLKLPNLTTIPGFEIDLVPVTSKATNYHVYLNFPKTWRSLRKINFVKLFKISKE